MMDGHFIDGSYSAFQASINNTFSFYLSYLSLLSKDNNKLRKSNDFLLFLFSSLNACKVIPIKKNAWVEIWSDFLSNSLSYSDYSESWQL